MEAALLPPFILAWTALALAVAVVLLFVSAPYGRFTRPGWGPRISSTVAWIVMEAPSPILFAVFFAIGERTRELPAIAFLILWECHYVHRAFVFPFRRRGGHKPMPLLIALQAVVFNCVNAWICGRWLFSYGPPHPDAWLTDPRFGLGVALFAVGLMINLWSDSILFGLRAAGETGYKIPQRGLYRLVSSPNYLGEILEWWGFAVATWSLAPVAFAIWTTANLAPRALSNHRWYRQRFPDYPSRRRALIPFVF